MALPALHTVFVSHAHADNAVCDRYVDALRARGLDVWYDRTNLQAGHSLSADIEAELRRRSAFVVMVTPASLASQWVTDETAAFFTLSAQDRTRLFLPVRAADCQMPLLWSNYFWIDAVNLGFDRALEKLAVTLGAPPARRAPEPVPTAPTAPPEPGEHVDKLFRQAEIADTLAQQARHLHERVHELLEQARAQQQANPQEAIELSEQATQLDPRDAEAWFELGKAYFTARRYHTALAAFDHALVLDDQRIEVWKYKAHTFDALQRYEETLATYERVLERDSKDVEVLFAKYQRLEALGRYREAKQAKKRWKYVAFGERSWPWQRDPFA